MSEFFTTFRAMGSQVNIWLDTPGDGSSILEQVPDWIEAIEARLSRFRPESELCRLNGHVGAWTDASDVMTAAIVEACRAAQVTGGLVTPLVLPALLAAGYDRSFDAMDPDAVSPGSQTSQALPLDGWRDITLDVGRVCLPGPIDLGGTAKGWTAQLIADELAPHGACLVDLGGDIVARGKPWLVELHDPFRPDTPFATLSLSAGAVATSGTDYRRWGAGNHHIIDPRHGRPAETDLISVSVIHPDAVLAEAYAKAVLLQGSSIGLAWLAHQPDAAGLAFDQEGRVLATANFKDFITQGA